MKKLVLPSAIALCLIILVSALMGSYGHFAFINMVFAADSYDNEINFVEVYHHNGSDWVLVGNCTASSGQSYRVHDGWEVRFIVNIRLNSTLASSTAEAVSYTRVYMNITYTGGTIWTNEELNNTASSLSGSYYYVEETGIWNQTGYPVAGVEYECKVDYDAYY